MAEMELHFPWLASFTMELRQLSFNLDQDNYYRLIYKFEGLISIEATKLRRKPNRANKLVAELRRVIAHLRLIAVSMGLDRSEERKGASLRGLGLILTHQIALINASSMKGRRSSEEIGSETYWFIKSILEGVGGQSLVLDTIIASVTTVDGHQRGSIGHTLLVKVTQDGCSYWGRSDTLLKFLLVLRLLKDTDEPNTKSIVSKAIAAIPRIPPNFEEYVKGKTGMKRRIIGPDQDLTHLVAILKPAQLIQISRDELYLPQTSEGEAVDTDDPSDGDGEAELTILLDTHGDQSLTENKRGPNYLSALGSLEVEEESSGSGDEDEEINCPTKYSTRSPSPHSPASSNERDMYEEVLGDSEEEEEELATGVYPADAISDLCIQPLDSELNKGDGTEEAIIGEEDEELNQVEMDESEAEDESEPDEEVKANVVDESEADPKAMVVVDEPEAEDEHEVEDEVESEAEDESEADVEVKANIVVDESEAEANAMVVLDESEAEDESDAEDASDAEDESEEEMEAKANVVDDESEASDSSIEIEEVFMAVKLNRNDEGFEDERDEASADSDSDHYYYPKIKNSWKLPKKSVNSTSEKEVLSVSASRSRAKEAVSSSEEEEEPQSSGQKSRTRKAVSSISSEEESIIKGSKSHEIEAMDISSKEEAPNVKCSSSPGKEAMTIKEESIITGSKSREMEAMDINNKEEAKSSSSSKREARNTSEKKEKQVTSRGRRSQASKAVSICTEEENQCPSPPKKPRPSPAKLISQPETMVVKDPDQNSTIISVADIQPKNDSPGRANSGKTMTEGVDKTLAVVLTKVMIDEKEDLELPTAEADATTPTLVEAAPTSSENIIKDPQEVEKESATQSAVEVDVTKTTQVPPATPGRRGTGRGRGRGRGKTVVDETVSRTTRSKTRTQPEILAPTVQATVVPSKRGRGRGRGCRQSLRLQ